MTHTGYICLKTHFDTLFTSAKIGTGFESLRETYKRAFKFPLGRYDIMTTDLRVSNNPINKITTLVGPYRENPEVPTGVIPCLNYLHCVSFINNEFLMGLNENNAVEYMHTIFNAITAVIRKDPFYTCTNINPYNVFISMLPLYLTYYHIAYVDHARLGDIEKDVIEWLEMYACNSKEDSIKVLESLKNNKFADTFESIYKVITCDNTISLFD